MKTSNKEDPKPNDPRLVGTTELARMLDISIRQVYRMKSKGDLPSPIYIGRLVRWALEDIKQWLSSPELATRR